MYKLHWEKDIPDADMRKTAFVGDAAAFNAFCDANRERHVAEAEQMRQS